MKPNILLISLMIVLASPIGLASPKQLSSADKRAAFKAAGYLLKGKEWRSECGIDDTDSASYSPGVIEEVRDINGDGHLEAIITEGGTNCYGMTGTGFTIVSKKRNGSWKLITAQQGIQQFLVTKGAENWPDISLGGPGYCFPVLRWDVKKYSVNRYEYEGKSCQPN